MNCYHAPVYSTDWDCVKTRFGANCICLALVLGIVAPNAAPIFYGLTIDCVFITPPGFCNFCVIACAGAVYSHNPYVVAACLLCLGVELANDISACSRRVR